MLNYDRDKVEILKQLDFLPEDMAAREKYLEALLKLLLFN